MSASADLCCHPATPGLAVRRIRAEVEQVARGILSLSFSITADRAGLRLPAPAAAQRVAGLWQHSCLEAFLQADGSDAYFEFNFSPSGAWAAYRFNSRRADRTVPELTAPHLVIRHRPYGMTLTVRLSYEGLPEMANATTLCAGLAAVVEDRQGGLSYWALAHRAARPDFHDPATFTLQLPLP